MTHKDPVAQPVDPVYTTYAPAQQCGMSRDEYEYEQRRRHQYHQARTVKEAVILQREVSCWISCMVATCACCMIPFVR